MKQSNIIGHGAQGIILHPAINPKLQQPEKYITKLGTYDDLKHEKYIYDNLPSEFDKIIYYKTCLLEINHTPELFKTYPEFKSEYNGLLTMKFYNGETIANLYKHINSKQTAYDVVSLLTDLYYKLYILNNTYFMFHGDISAHNIIIDINKNSVKLIDFGLGRIFNSKEESIGSRRTHDLNKLLHIINKIINKKIQAIPIPFTSIKDITLFINGLNII